MRSTVDYEIVSGDEDYVVKRVKKKIQEGWEPIGGVSIVLTDGQVHGGVRMMNSHFSQALVRYQP